MAIAVMEIRVPLIKISDFMISRSWRLGLIWAGGGGSWCWVTPP